jgi:phage-related protein
MSIVGAGVNEIRVRDESGAYRVLYVAKFEEAVYVLHVLRSGPRRPRKAIFS